MNDALMSMLQYSAGVAFPIRLQVRDPHGEIRIVEWNGPYGVIGRGDECHLCLPDPVIGYRQLYLQAIGNRLAAVDLLGPATAQWQGAPFTGWFGPQHRLDLAGYSIQLADSHWLAEEALPGPLDFKPRDGYRSEYGMLPEVELTMLNTSSQGRAWPINRVITLFGRDERCRITVMDEKISKVHCAFLLLPTGLWVIDMFGRLGVKVNGEVTRCALLAQGAELQIGPYRLATNYPQLAAQAVQIPQQTVDSVVFGEEFVTRQNRILAVETFQDILVISPLGNTQTVLYQDVHVESSRVQQLLSSPRFKKVVIDLDRAEVIGPHLLTALVAICKHPSTERAVLCGGSPELRSQHERSTLLRIWNHVANRSAAIQALLQV